jgi:tRNA(Ile)-lysidine synthase
MQVQSGDHLTVALSGGVDSAVLLHLLVPFASQMQIPLSAVHVNHGISPNADKWSEFCQTLCQSRSIPLEIASVKVTRAPGTSLEAAAREERYRIFEISKRTTWCWPSIWTTRQKRCCCNCCAVQG